MLVGYEGASPIYQDYCLEHADREEADPPLVSPAIPKLMVRSGALLGLIAVAADYLDISGRSGFGWRQILGTEIGALCLVLGAFLRIGLLSLLGVVLFCVSLGADYLAVGHSQGTGWREVAAEITAVILVGAGLLLQLRERRRRH
jgi:hypothetical protein